jgi:hypothetical protein
VKAAHEAAVALLGCLYSLKPTASARALDGTAVVAAPEPVPFNLFGGADEESTAVAATPEPGSMFDLLDGADTLSEAEIEELKFFVPEAGDIVDGVVNRDKIATNLEKLLWKHREFPNLHHMKTFVLRFADVWGFHVNIASKSLVAVGTRQATTTHKVRRRSAAVDASLRCFVSWAMNWSRHFVLE